MSVARFIADQRTNYRVPVAVCCAILGLSVGWFYKWVKAPVTDQLRRRRELDAKVRELFDASQRTYGSPRIHRDLVEAGWSVGENTVADSMRRQGLFGRKPKRSKGLTRQDRAAAKFPGLGGLGLLQCGWVPRGGQGFWFGSVEAQSEAEHPGF